MPDSSPVFGACALARDICKVLGLDEATKVQITFEVHMPAVITATFYPPVEQEEEIVEILKKYKVQAVGNEQFPELDESA